MVELYRQKKHRIRLSQFSGNPISRHLVENQVEMVKEIIFASLNIFHTSRCFLTCCNMLRYGPDGFTSGPKEGVLHILSPLKIHRPRIGLNSRTLEQTGTYEVTGCIPTVAINLTIECTNTTEITVSHSWEYEYGMLHSVSHRQRIALMVEAQQTSETSVNFYDTTRHNIPEDSHLHTNKNLSL
jgi:hypothetical protein